MRSNKKILAAVMCCMFMFGFGAFVSAEPEKSVWAGTDLEFKSLADPIVVVNSGVPDGYGGKKEHCTNMNITLRKEEGISFFVGHKSELIVPICGLRTTSGYIGGTYYLPNYASIAGKLTPPSGYGIASIFPIKDSSTAIGMKAIGNGAVNIYIMQNAYDGIKGYIDSKTGLTTYEMKNNPGTLLKNSKNELISLQAETITFSDNGKWLVADSKTNGMVRINVATGQIFAFATTFNYNSGNNPFTQFAISNDGRYVAAASYQQSVFNLYDLGICPTTNTRSPYNNTCYVRDLKSYVKTKLSTHTGGANRLEFIRGSLQFVTTYDQTNNTSKTFGRYSIAPLGTEVANYSKVDYLALGDSFASGEGVYNYNLITDIPDNRCHLSYDSYPYLLNNQLDNVASTESVACSGAKMKDVIITDNVSYSNDPQAKGKIGDQFDDVIYDNFLPGYRSQQNFVNRYMPNIITISMSGNDMGFGGIIKKCITSGDECYQFYEDRAEIVSIINNMYTDLVDMYVNIKKEANTNAKIYVIGYPEFAKPYNDCAVNVRLSNNEIIFGNSLVSYLNSIIEMASLHAGVKYVDVSHAFYGYRLCETESYNAAMNGLTAGNSSFIPGVGPLGSESYHPNKKGHELYAQTIRQKTNDFTATMPTPVAGNPLQVDEGALLFVTSAPHNDSIYLNSFYDDQVTAQDSYYVSDAIKITLKEKRQQLAPNTSSQVWLYSDPVLLGNVTTNSTGEIDGSVEIPDNMPAGYHTLKIITKNIAGEQISIQKIIYVGFSENDLDGDGMVNSEEECLIGEPVNLDVDKDGVDDACDGFIAQAPAMSDPEATKEPESPTPPIEVIDEQPEVISRDKELPESESRPEWLLMKEREIAEEQAAANQSTTIPQPEQNAVQTRQQSSQTAQEPNEQAQTTEATTANTRNTTVAGVSSAVEERSTSLQQQNYWWAYVLAAIVTILFGFGVYRYIAEENKV